MSETNNKRSRKRLPLWLIFLPLIDLALLIRYFMNGRNIALFNPKGYIATEQHKLMVFAIVVLLVIAVPSLCLAYFIAWRYRDTNSKAKHNPNPRQNKRLVLFIWLVPTTAMIILATVMWSSTYKLYPQKVIKATNEPLTIQVISLRWKWLFIYPDQKVATVNFVQLPVNTPITFEMTADETPMSSFWIPNLGGQLYTMTSHVNRLNLMATEPGVYHGSSAEINGPGFAGMKFTASVGSTEEFYQWVQNARKSPDVLDAIAYKKLLIPSEYNASEYFSSFDPQLYSRVVYKYEGHEEH